MFTDKTMIKLILEIFFTRNLYNFQKFNFKTYREMKKFIKSFRSNERFPVEKDNGVIVCLQENVIDRWYVFNDEQEKNLFLKEHLENSHFEEHELNDFGQTFYFVCVVP